VINPAPASVVLSITSTRQNFGHLLEVFYEAHSASAQTADSAKVQFSHCAPYKAPSCPEIPEISQLS